MSLKQFLEDPFNYVEKAKLSDITKLIKYANDSYYNTDKQLMSDEEYDLLKDELMKRKPDHKLLKDIGSKVHSKKKVELPYHMGSMDKIKPGKQLVEKWIKKYKGPYVVSDKLDGTSGLLVLPDKKLYTRGNGKVGTDISSLIPFINGIPNTKKKLVIRGELIISKANFKKFSKQYTNSRAMVNGLINKKCAVPEELKYIDFVAYELVSPHKKISDQFKLLSKFETVYNKKVNEISEESLSNLLKTRKNTSKYDIDGIIIVNDQKHSRNTDGNPKYAFAYKDILEEQIATTKVIKVEWNVSKDGRMKPRVFVEATKIGGITIKHVTGHNAKYIKESGIGKGAVIKLIRSGDVIPYILEVIKKVKPEYPKIDYVWSDSGIEILINKMNTSDQTKYDMLVKNMTFFVKKMKIKYVDESIIKKFIKIGINSIPKLLKACSDDFLKVENFKERMATKVYNNIRSSLKNVKLSLLMAASNIFGSGLGEKKIALITKAYPNILADRSKKLIDKIIDIDGFSTKTATEFVKGLPEFKKFLKSLPKMSFAKTKKITKHKHFYGKTFVFTGFRNKEWEQLIELGGGKVSGTVSGNTDVLVVKDKSETSSKIKKAKELNIKIIDVKQFEKLI